MPAVSTKATAHAIREIKRDMERPQPMDRLFCGDVGFGKTEVAMRAAFKALGDGKQIAILAPTTVSVSSISRHFKRRFPPFPVRVEMFGRFRRRKKSGLDSPISPKGRVDIVDRAHTASSLRTREFKDWAHLLVDEEQRFGVRHKERLKQLKKAVDASA